MMPKMESRDTVVIGAGHDGPATALSLAKAGLRIRVVENSERAGDADIPAQ